MNGSKMSAMAALRLSRSRIDIHNPIERVTVLGIDKIKVGHATVTRRQRIRSLVSDSQLLQCGSRVIGIFPVAEWKGRLGAGPSHVARDYEFFRCRHGHFLSNVSAASSDENQPECIFRAQAHSLKTSKNPHRCYCQRTALTTRHVC